MTLCWLLSLLDCNGGIENFVHYRNESAYTRVVGTQDCGDRSLCPLYFKENFITLDSQTNCASEPMGDPLPNEIWYLQTTAIDEAGNEDCGI